MAAPQARVSGHPLVQHKLTILRDKNTEPKRFRELVRELAALLTYEAMAGWETKAKEVETPMAKFSGVKIDLPIVVPILRAGLGMSDGALDVIPQSETRHIGLFRDEETLKPVTYYGKQLPQKGAKPFAGASGCLLLDPMLATGGSAIAATTMLKEGGATRIVFVCLIAAPEGVKNFAEAHPDVPIIAGAVDEKLNDVGYIVPGLGDAGDRQFGTV